MSTWTPSIVPRDDDHTVYLVMDDLDRLGRVWRETDTEATDIETAIPTCSNANTQNRFG